MQLRAAVIETCCRICIEAHCFELKRVMSDQVGLQCHKRGLSTLAAAAHFTESDEACVGLNLEDRAYEAAPVGSIGMTQRSLERD